MGGRGSAGTRNSSNIFQPQVFKQVNREVVSNWVDTQDAHNYLDDSPASIQVGGVNFTWIGGNQTNYGDRYVNTYQSSEQASNGEYPVIEIVVTKQKIRGGGYKWVFDRTTFGTGLR